jgi:hypothetical protein
VSGESLAWWAFIASLYIAAFAVLQLEKHWHRTAQFLFSLATLFALIWLVLQVWKHPDGLYGGVAFVTGVAVIVANIWFVRKVEQNLNGKIRSDNGSARPEREAFIIRQLEALINEERQISQARGGSFTLGAGLAKFNEIFTFRRKVEHFLVLHLSPEHVSQFQQKGVYALQEMIKELIEGELIPASKNDAAGLYGKIICREITLVLNAKEKHYNCFVTMQVDTKTHGQPTLARRWQLDLLWEGVDYPSVRQPVADYYVKRPTFHADDPAMSFEERQLTEFPTNEEITTIQPRIGWLRFSIGALPLSAVGDFQRLHKDVILRLKVFDSRDNAHLIYEGSSEGLSGCGTVERHQNNPQSTVGILGGGVPVRGRQQVAKVQKSKEEILENLIAFRNECSTFLQKAREGFAPDLTNLFDEYEQRVGAYLAAEIQPSERDDFLSDDGLNTFTSSTTPKVTGRYPATRELLNRIYTRGNRIKKIVADLQAGRTL